MSGEMFLVNASQRSRYYASQAMVGLLASGRLDDESSAADVMKLAETSFAIAEAMLKAEK